MVHTFCSRLKSRTQAEAFETLYGGEGKMPDFPIFGLVMILAFMHKKSSGCPIGGSLEFARANEPRAWRYNPLQHESR